MSRVIKSLFSERMLTVPENGGVLWVFGPTRKDGETCTPDEAAALGERLRGDNDCDNDKSTASGWECAIPDNAPGEGGGVEVSDDREHGWNISITVLSEIPSSQPQDSATMGINADEALALGKWLIKTFTPPAPLLWECADCGGMQTNGYTCVSCRRRLEEEEAREQA